jgi:uncharacterized protein
MTVLALLIVAVSAIFATGGQAGGTGFLAVLALTGLPDDEKRLTALALNVMTAGYATWRLQAARISAPFILANSTAALTAALLAGQRVGPTSIGLLAGAALADSAIGTAIGLRWMSEAMTR